MTRAAHCIVTARLATAAGFAPFGRLLDLSGAEAPGTLAMQGEGWSDSFTLAPLIEGKGHLGRTIGEAAPWTCRRMERHPLTEEALFCAAEPVVLAVAPAGPAEAPDTARIEAFILSPGQALVMNKGVWHDACRGVNGATPYYWMAVCGFGPDPWVAPADGPAEIRL